jgi:hypothetical protein
MRSQGRDLGRRNYKCTQDEEMCHKLHPVTLSLPQQGPPPPPTRNSPPSSTLPKTNDIDLNIDIDSVLEKINVHVPLKEIIKIPSMKSRVEKFFKVQGEPVDPPIMLQANHFRPQYDEHPPFFISLQVNNKLLNNCMLDSGVGASIMSLKVMRQLGLETTRPYRNVCGIESRAIPTHGVIENVKVHLDRYPEMVFLIDIVVIDVPDVWGMLLSRKFVATLGGTLQMDLTYATIPMDDNTYAYLPNLTMEKNHVEEIDLDPETEEIPEVVKESLPYFFPDDLPFTQEEDFDAIEWPKKEYYQQQLDKYKDKEIGSVKILKKDDKDLLIRPSQDDVLTTESHPLPRDNIPG